ncbi:MAG: hypothetical protein ACRDKV_08415 [Solirubrobacterales bacterium]
MTLFRAIPLAIHGVVEVLAATVLIAAPFLLGFGYEAGAVSIVLGTMLMGLALSTHGEHRTVPLTAHAGLDYVIGGIAIVGGLALAIADAPLVATTFLVGFGAAHMALTASTRFSIRGA